MACRRHCAAQRLRQGTYSFKPKPDYDVSRMRVVAFLQNVKNGEVIQALPGLACK